MRHFHCCIWLKDQIMKEMCARLRSGFEYYVAVLHWLAHSLSYPIKYFSAKVQLSQVCRHEPSPHTTFFSIYLVFCCTSSFAILLILYFTIPYIYPETKMLIIWYIFKDHSFMWRFNHFVIFCLLMEVNICEYVKSYFDIEFECAVDTCRNW